jgi:hypothetical protein
MDPQAYDPSASVFYADLGSHLPPVIEGEQSDGMVFKKSTTHRRQTCLH